VWREPGSDVHELTADFAYEVGEIPV
jgi:hypothetical protein